MESTALARVSLVMSGAPTVVAALLGLTTSCASPPEEETAQSETTLSGSGASWGINGSGFALTATSTREIDGDSAFFQSLGTNGRTCESCHLAGEGWSITPSRLRLRFHATEGRDPIFAPHDAANAPNLDVSTVAARREAYSLLLSRGTIRVGLPVKPTSEFVLLAVDDPYGWASAAQLSLFRRPLPTTNLRFLTVINWDGRSTPAADLTNIQLGLRNQSNGATVNHAKATAPIDDAVREEIVGFEVALATAQVWHWEAGSLASGGATGGPTALLAQPFASGDNDPGEAGFTRRVFTLYDAWTHDSGSWYSAGRRRVASGQRIFNERTFDTGGGRTGTCSGCHSAPNVGSSSSFRFFDVGVSKPERRSSAVPLYTFQNVATGETIQTTDPGRALITGLWSDMNRFKVPGLRGLAARAPYFHDGSARTLRDVVDHYQRHFHIDLGSDERNDLVMFLESL